MSWIERFRGAAVTVSVIVAEPLRPCASEIEIGRDFVPGVVVMVKLIFTDPIVAIEADRESEVLQRSRQLAAGNLGRIFLAILPALPLSLAHMYAALRALQYSRWLMVPIDSLFCVLDQWMTVVVLLLYLGLAAEPRTNEAAKRKAA